MHVVVVAPRPCVHRMLARALSLPKNNYRSPPQIHTYLYTNVHNLLHLAPIANDVRVVEPHIAPHIVCICCVYTVLHANADVVNIMMGTGGNDSTFFMAILCALQNYGRAPQRRRRAQRNLCIVENNTGASTTNKHKKTNYRHSTMRWRLFSGAYDTESGVERRLHPLQPI